MSRAFLSIFLALPALSGCIVGDIAKTAVQVVAVPVKVVAKGIDSALPSQQRADEQRGRELRREDERRAVYERQRNERCRRNHPLPTDVCRTVSPR